MGCARMWRADVPLGIMAVLFGAILLVGCANQSPGRQARSVPTPHPTSAAQLELPIAAYELSEMQSQEEQYVKQRLIQACMLKYGFSYLPELSSSSVPDGVRILQEFDSRRYGVSDMRVAREYGYHVPPWTMGTGQPDLKAQLSPAELLVLAGPVGGAHAVGGSAVVAGRGSTRVPPGGCEGEANNELAAAGIDEEAQAGASNESSLAQDIEGQAFTQAQSDPRVLAVFVAWSACMRRHGYDYSTPFKAAADPQWNMSSPATRTEIQTAETDVSCKQKTNLLGITFAVESDYENAAIAKNALALAQVKYRVAAQARMLERLMVRYGK